MSSPSRILELATIISTNTSLIQTHLQTHKLPTPSFTPVLIPGTCTLSSDFSNDLPLQLNAARDAVLDATSELQNLLLPPLDLMYHNFNHNALVALQAIQRFNIPKLVPLTEMGTTFAKIATAINLREIDVRRLLRYAMTFHVFQELHPGSVTHTTASAALTNKSMSDWAASVCNDVWPAAQRTVDALQKWPASQDPSHTGFCLATNSTEPMYKQLTSSPEKAQRFAGMMDAYTAAHPHETAHLLAGFEWGSVQSVVDIGGSHGHILFLLARSFPSLKLVIQDLPSVIAQVNVPDELKDRVSVKGADFFEDQDTSSDVYYLRWVLHNWGDEDAVRILRALIPALEKGFPHAPARVVIHDDVMPELGGGKEVAVWRERALRSADLCMLELMNARGRELGEWKDLLMKADARFRFEGCRRPRGSDLAFIVIGWEGGKN